MNITKLKLIILLTIPVNFYAMQPGVPQPVPAQVPMQPYQPIPQPGVPVPTPAPVPGQPVPTAAPVVPLTKLQQIINALTSNTTLNKHRTFMFQQKLREAESTLSTKLVAGTQLVFFVPTDEAVQQLRTKQITNVSDYIFYGWGDPHSLPTTIQNIKAPNYTITVPSTMKQNIVAGPVIEEVEGQQHGNVIFIINQIPASFIA